MHLGFSGPLRFCLSNKLPGDDAASSFQCLGHTQKKLHSVMVPKPGWWSESSGNPLNTIDSWGAAPSKTFSAVWDLLPHNSVIQRNAPLLMTITKISTDWDHSKRLGASRVAYWPFTTLYGWYSQHWLSCFILLHAEPNTPRDGSLSKVRQGVAEQAFRLEPIWFQRVCARRHTQKPASHVTQW